jgi:hypothetical protein
LGMPITDTSFRYTVRLISSASTSLFPTRRLSFAVWPWSLKICIDLIVLLHCASSMSSLEDLSNFVVYVVRLVFGG